MTKKPKKTITVTDEDKTLFRSVIKGVKPLTHTKTELQSEPPIKKTPQRPPAISDETAGFQFSDFENLPEVASEDLLYFARVGVQDKMLRKLRQGQYNVDAILDLHGKTVAEAREALSRFLLYCHQNQLRHILIIHGKGRGTTKPVLKNKLNHWLRQTDQVLAFSSAAPADGRAGALYILLRRK